MAHRKDCGPHPKQVPNLLDQVMASMPLNANDHMIFNEPLVSHTGPCAYPVVLVSHMTGLLYDNNDLELST